MGEITHSAPEADDTSDAAPLSRDAWRLIAGASLGAIALVGLAGLLWIQHGGTVFFDTLSAGLAACF
ncbi:MAG: hypothetical protein B7Z15_02380 [Rhizobiales bacterium 32-66-8]|nr:MAG: hypothetical protein B7Z15_02380 [Rhizobiales bacterium 32-66-8]